MSRGKASMSRGKALMSRGNKHSHFYGHRYLFNISDWLFEANKQIGCMCVCIHFVRIPSASYVNMKIKILSYVYIVIQSYMAVTKVRDKREDTVL